MPASPSRVRRTAVRRIAAQLAGFLAAAVLVLGSGANAARAHDALTGATPAQDATVDTSPSQVSLQFSQAPQALGTQVLVSGPDGEPASEGAVEVEGTRVIQPLVSDLPAGSYTVHWRVSSADGHPLSGSFTFAVAHGAAAGANAPDTHPADSVREAPSGTPAAAPGGSSPLVTGTAMLAVLAAAGFLVIRQRRTAP